jgi:cytochrome b subunit of formate dehydrogenase
MGRGLGSWALRVAVTALGALVLGPAGALAQAVCADCHDEVAVRSPMHAVFTCQDCHFDVDPEDHPGPPVELSSRAVCAQCHDPGSGLIEGAHRQVGCSDCHGAAHDVLPPADAASPLEPRRQLATCGSCHGDPPELLDGYRSSVHGWALHRAGLVHAAPSCTDCHGGHELFAAEDTRSQVHQGAVPTTCGSCHLGILEDWQELSAHGVAWRAGDPEAPVCTTCHASHEIEPPRIEAQRLKSPQDCGGCHGESYATYRDSFHGKATDLGFLTAATCSDCHTPHANLPASDPRASIHPENLQATCGTCHGAVTVAFTSFDPHADPRDASRNLPLHVIWRAMTTLLVVVFGFFGLHALLWLQRSVVALVRGELAGGHPPRGPYVRRFTSSQRWTHVVVVVTFLTLAATGLPLHFHYAGWAQVVADLFGGVAGARVLHRLAAIATFGYFAFHVGQLFVRGVVRREEGMLWGWGSLVPRPKDLADLGANLRYFLYLGRRPRLDRWTYWEKFDYFAVFWGVAIIGFSGLMLWFPRFFTSFLPGWALNAAAVVHGEEALLAVGFIFVFHFFHTHLRPESFPLDPVIFTGSMPLERFQEERPLEYQRLLDRGELDDLLVPPPTEEQLRWAHGFGFTAVAVGVSLVLAILWGVLAY